MKRIGIFVFDDMEELDAIGPYEVLGMARSQRPSAIDVCLVAETLARPVRCVNGLRLLADHDFASAPPLDVLLIPGGTGTRAAATNPRVLEWVTTCADKAEIVASVCTGARITLAAGLAANRRITTHHSAIEELRRDGRAAEVLEGVRFVQDGPVVHSAGVSAGIDMTLWLVGRICDPDLARSVARMIEYSPAATEAHS
jgi:transcriptional regulator GlxA family with amidase domain